ncbi:uncharacterized protein LOC132747784, partial [Ruditapes philippinarum]|uniref:uncharacterized protein LOC132747784 n=1 Tax=Ruditapes philippinarum TaxID=129788 RepID=UPI00295B6167
LQSVPEPSYSILLTVIQRRLDGSENFYRTWTDYVCGFGNRSGEYWLSLENIYRLTTIDSSLRIEMEAFEDISPTSAIAHYSMFKVDDEASNFRLHVSGFSGNCGDSLSLHDGNMFSTKDRDNDESEDNCAQMFKGAWWYEKCHHSNLNGMYLSGSHSSYANGIGLGEEWTNSSETVMLKLSYINEIQKRNNLVSMSQGIFFPACKFHCMEWQYAAFIYIESNKTCLCGSEEYANNVEYASSDENTGIVYTSEKLNKKIHRLPGVFDCLSLYELGYAEDGMYVIQPKEGVDIGVWCDMSNGGWTVIQRPQDGSENFYRNWNEYVNGFGNTTGEYWLGLKYINILTTIGSALYIDMETFEHDNVSPASAFAEYSTFKVNDETDKYRLTVCRILRKLF